MKTRAAIGIAFVAGGVILAASFLPACSEEVAPVFGGPDDVGFAQALWEGMDGYQNWPIASDVYAGASPHGAFLKVYYSVVPVNGVPYHVLVKDNFGGMNATVESVTEDPGAYLMAVTVMVQREAGYDDETMNWFWVKFNGDGTVSQNDAGMRLAGRVAKGMTQGCIACHANAQGGDYLFFND